MSHYLAYVKNKLAAAQAGVDKFVEALKKNPAHAMKWSDGVFTDAAGVEVYTSLVHALENENVTLEQIEDHISGQLMNKASAANNYSTGQGSNMLEDGLLSVYCEELKTIKRFLKDSKS